ncbi:5954_t:CDS:2 [Acaulospora morrowiae]|uniref:5954_t:CDS:1 n=1 Tax=Acaulospora morrowiae TaxID=94023 RepID=A0A9N9GSR9_9GLOM|nr:5954_t:CDS:2 [Acaulospora morrowiae]
MLEPDQSWFFTAWLLGVVALVHLHNAFASIFSQNVQKKDIESKVIKFIFNFSGMLAFICKFASIGTPSNVTSLGCKVILYTASLANFIYGGSLSIFLLRRLKQFKMDYDRLIGLVLVAARMAANITHIVFLGPEAHVIPSPYSFYKTINVCVYNSDAIFRPQLATILADFAIDLYVAARLVPSFRKSGRDANSNHIILSMKRDMVLSLVKTMNLRN